MTKWNLEEIRSKFINYFVSNNHTYVPASPLIPHNDPSLMFVNSGMVQFKDVFTGIEKRNYDKATSSQKSVRAGGKHNDLDNVGYTARHHTFFEMLGNFSFGDYFKEEAIYYAWDLLTKEFSLPKEKLYATVYHTDDEAISYWKKIAGLDDDRIIKIKTLDNFWSMGDTGPCGPCSEIFYDHGDHIKGGLPGTKDEDGDRYIEIWNMVFMQFEQIDKNTRIDLPKKSIDTGMGLERISAVLQGVHDNYDIDLFKDLISYAENIVKIKANAGEARFSYRVIVDHLRSAAFLIADGVMPSNEGRGYVLRRIMRRAMRHSHQLGCSEPLMYKLFPKLVDLMGNNYPELKRAQEFISSILKDEEMRFKITLERGLKLLEDELQNLQKNLDFPGQTAFKLYDTYGFPLDLTQDILKVKQIKVDVDSFNSSMLQQKERARKSWSGSGEAKQDALWFNLKLKHGSTEFLGYSLDSLEAKVIAIIKEGKEVASINGLGEKFIILTNQTPFYGESGGQMGDIGTIESSNCIINVIDTHKYVGALHAHICILESGKISVDDIIKLSIKIEYRKSLRAHHSATHILHAVLREVLGTHITQKGSLVAHDRLRFDINHPNSLTKEEINLIEDKVNQIIMDNSDVTTNLMSIEKAIESGAMALFGEKYDNEVRVVSMGILHENGKNYSLELCGGTHVSKTGDIGAFKIINETAIAAGIRRIEAICGKYTLELSRQNEDLIIKINEILKSTKSEIINKLSNLILSKKETDKEIEKLKLKAFDLSIEEINNQAINLGEVKLLYNLIEEFDPKIIRNIIEKLSKQLTNLIVIYVNKVEKRLSINIAISREIADKYNASTIAKTLSLKLGGTGGGGSNILAQSGGDSSMLQGLSDKIQHIINSQ